jgi:hypothetical protein
MPCNLPGSNKRDLKENSCVSFGAGIFMIEAMKVSRYKTKEMQLLTKEAGKMLAIRIT